MAEAGVESMDTIPKHTNLKKFYMLTKFLLPLVVAQMVPAIGEQVLNRGITSLATDEMVVLLASFGLASYLVKTLAVTMFECRHISIVLVHSIADYKRMLLLILLMSGTLSVVILVVGLTPAGTWLIQDLHRQSEEVTEIALFIFLFLMPLPILEAVGNFHEGGLIKHKLTMYAGAAKFVEFCFQVLFVVAFLFTPTRDEPIYIPLCALYAGIIGRVILDIGFWYVLVRRELPATHATEKPTGLLKGFKFFLPLGFVRLIQVVYRPMINLVVSRQLAATSVEKSTEALATLTAVYPTGKVVCSWLNDLRTVAPTFHKQTDTHEKFGWRLIGAYSAFCTLVVFALNAFLFIIPGPAYFIMHTIMGLLPELANMTLLPLKIYSGICIFVGLRATCSGYLIYKKKTMYLTPSAVVRLGFGILSLLTLPYAGVVGAELGISSLLIGFVVEAITVVLALLVLKYITPRIVACRAKKNHESEESAENNDTELQPLSI